MTNIVSTISRVLTPEILEKLAATSGLDRTLAKSAVAAAVPSILSALASGVAMPGGARQLANAVAEQPTDFLQNLANSFTGSARMPERGTAALSALLGGGAVNLLTSTVGRFLGIGERSTAALMGMLTSVIMGVLHREQQAAGLDANGLARMLVGQKEEISEALPPGLGDLLQNSGLYEATGSTSAFEEHKFDTPRTELPRIFQRAGAEPPRMQGVTWPYWVLPLLALAGLLWYLLPRGHETVEPARTSQTPAQSTPPATTAERTSVYLTRAPNDWVSIGSVSNDYVNQDIFNRTGEKLGTIKDVLKGPDGKMVAAIINVGRYLGIGDKDIAVRFSALHVEQRDSGRRIAIDATKETLQAAPVFERH
jgi:hypothetical protein